jgi:putative transposase
MSSDVRRRRTAVHALSVQPVFVTKYRRGVITARVREHLQASLAQSSQAMGAELLECDGEDDHLHLLVDYPPRLSVSRMVNALKLASSMRLRKASFPEVRCKLWGIHFWRPSYYAGSCGGANLQTVEQYIHGQRQLFPNGRR